MKLPILVLVPLLLLGAGCSSKKVVPPPVERHFFDLDAYIEEQQKTRVTISPATTTEAFANTAFRQEFTAVGIDTKTGQWIVSKGELPPGVTLQTAAEKNKAIIAGTVSSTPGTYTFELSASDETRHGTNLYTILVRSPLSVNTNKTAYALNEPIQIVVQVYNGDPVNLTLLPCPIHYTIEPLLDAVESVQTLITCPIQEENPIVLRPKETRTWTFTHTHDLFGSSPGEHTISVDVSGNNNFRASTTIAITP